MFYVACLYQGPELASLHDNTFVAIHLCSRTQELNGKNISFMTIHLWQTLAIISLGYAPLSLSFYLPFVYKLTLNLVFCANYYVGKKLERKTIN